MCGGTLGICVALALQQKGFRVAVVEKRRVEGRLQEWNTSRHELQVGAVVCWQLCAWANWVWMLWSEALPAHSRGTACCICPQGVIQYCVW